MGIMIEDQEIIALLTDLADRIGKTKAEALRTALKNDLMECELRSQEKLFPRDRVTHLTYRL